jgi:uncharacterized repeat protein (TIGR01451 family)
MENIAITKMADVSLAKPGDDITYTINVTNNGPDEAVNVVVSDTLNANVTFNTASPLPDISDSLLTWNLGNLANGESVPIELIVTVNGDVQPGTTISNIATVVSDTDDPDDTDNETPPEDTDVG